MNFFTKPGKPSIAARLIIAVAFGHLTQTALHAQTAAAASQDETVKLSELVVTGSYIPTAADRTDVPVATISTQDILDTGLNSNLLDILTKAMPEFGGRSNQGNRNATNTNVFTAGGSQLALRNLDTLVLINGRRASTSGLNAINGKSFVDINMIPTAAIDHMEVLTDGASAIYGSDAVGGVVNIILKKNYQGAEVGARYAVTDNPGHYSERSAYVIAGARAHGIGITVTGSWSKTDPIWQSQRPFIAFNPQSLTSFPGYVGGNFLKPGLTSPSQSNPVGLNATAPTFAALIANGTYVAAGSPSIPPFNAAPYENIVQQDTQKGVSATLEADIFGRHLQAFGDFLRAQTNSFNQNLTFLGNVAATGSTISSQFPIAPVPAGSPYNPVAGPVSNVVVGDLDIPTKIYNQASGLRGTFGFRGEVNPDLNWEVGATYSEEATDENHTNELFAPNLNAAIAGGYDANGNPVRGGAYSRVIAIDSYSSATPRFVIQPALDPFARSGINPAALANVYGTEFIHTKSTLLSYDAKVVYMPIDLPGGKLAAAAGAAWRKEHLLGVPDQNSYNLSTAPQDHNWGAGSLFFDPFARSRTISSYFGELRIPITGPSWSLPAVRVLEVSLAARHEKYSDWGASSVPKIGLRWQPIDDQLTFRFTYSKAFTAPRLYDEYGPQSVSLQSGNSFLVTNVTSPTGGSNSSFLGLPYFNGNGNNPTIQPSTAISRSLGFVASPKAIPGFTLSVDYINVANDGLAAGLGGSNIVQSVNQLGSASPYFSQLALGALPGTPGANQTPLATPFGLYKLLASGNYQQNLYILDHFINSGGVKQEVFDINPQYSIPTATAGIFTVGTTGTYMRHFLVSQVPGQPFYEFAGYATNGTTESGTFPRWRFYTTADWKFHGWDFLVANTYVSKLTDILLGQIPAVYLQNHTPTYVNYYTSWDTQISYTFNKAAAGRLWSYLRGLTLSTGVTDIFNRMPPYSPLAQAATLNSNNVDASTYTPVGRLFYVSGNMKF